MKILTKDLLNKLPPLYSQENVKVEDKIVYAKFFYPDFSWTWYATEYDPEERMFFGFVDGFEGEWGYFSLDELEATKGKLGCSIERDLFFKPCKFSECQILSKI